MSHLEHQDQQNNRFHVIQDVRIRDIKIGNRFRKDLGDLDALAASIKELGVVQPVVLTPELELVCGERTFRACRDKLGWMTVPTRILPVQSVLLGQIAPNLLQKSYTVSERIEITEALRSFGHGGDRRSDQLRNGEVETLTMDTAAKLAGLGGKDGYYRAKAVLEKGIPDLIAEMDRGEIAIAAAAEIAELCPEDQRHSLSRGRRAIGRDPHDHYPTPDWVTEALLERENFGNILWEPACGSGAMAEVLKKAGYGVHSSDLIDRGYGEVEDFLQSSYTTESIVTNPPFKLAEEFVAKALKRATYKVAFFLPLTFLEGERRHKLLANSPLKTVHVFSKRVSLYKGGVENRGNGRAAYAWYVWEHGYEGPPTLSWITARDEYQPELAGGNEPEA